MTENIQKTKSEPTILTVHDVADYLCVSESKVYRLVKEHQLPAIRLGKTWRFRKDLPDAWFGECTEASIKSI